eukprot:TRINITY_DN7796_c0_g1_i3.p1 TRINITY_DN7796_c0_g1~~TRINITY_DN7796_c0_g1_i3.p1  ORF type:complete len:111 (-),score=11.80 TRINITY_DN7796_c0_g1_i3:61-393(-)
MGHAVSVGTFLALVLLCGPCSVTTTTDTHALQEAAISRLTKVSGAFCHPDGNRHTEGYRYGRYDFRVWADPSKTLEERGALMKTLLERAYGPESEGRWRLVLNVSEERSQ